MITYPALLPAPTRDYSLSVKNSASRTEMESGRKRQVRRFLESENTVQLVWLFTDTEYQLFDSWAFHALSGATAWFECPIVSGGGVQLHIIRIQAGEYTAKLDNGMSWRVTAAVDVETVNRKTEAEVFEEVIGVNLIDFSNQVVETVNDYYSE